MKRFVFSCSAVLTLLFFSCGKKGGISDAAQKNLNANDSISKAIESGDVSKLGDYMATDAVEHGDHGEIKGLDSIKVELAGFALHCSNIKNEILHETADDNYVWSWMRLTGITKDASMGFPTGTKFDMNSVELTKFKDGKAAEHWTFMQPADMMKIMASYPPPPSPDDNNLNTTPKDSTRM